jgi:hypothetical protein
MHLYEGALGKRRYGSVNQTLTGDAHTGYNALIRFVPGQDDTAAELFIVSTDATVKILRVAAGTVKANLTLTDNVATRAWDIDSAVLNGKLYLAYDSTVNRLHVFDPGLSTTTVRRAGMGTPAAPTGADQGAGGLSLTRSYKVAYTEQRGGVTVRRSELSPVLTRTIAAKLGSTITKPASISEAETHWELYASDTATGTFYLMATTVVGTTTYSDTAATIDTTATAEATVGVNTPFPSVKYLATDGNRLLGYGVWETTAGDSMTPRSGRVYFTPVLDSSASLLAVNDDERISNSLTVGLGYIDITRNAGSIDRGLAGPLNGTFFALQDRGITMLSPTGSPEVPYRRIPLSDSLGSVNQQSIVMAEDEVGRPAMYFLDPALGPYRYGAGGFQRVGKDVQDIWDGVNTSATNIAAWGIYYKSLNIIIWAVATASSNDPDTMLIYDVTEGRLTDADGVRNGWTVWDGDFAGTNCGVMFGTLGASMGRKLVPYAGRNSGSKLLRYDPFVDRDDSVAFKAYFTSGAFSGSALPRNKQVTGKSYLLATAQTGVTITQTWTRNFGDETARTNTVVLTPTAAGETNVLKRFESPELAEAYVAQVTIGDAAAQNVNWTLERWYCQFEDKELR